jgi:hypothetical protein
MIGSMTLTELTAVITGSGALAAAAWATISWTLNLREKRRTDEYVRKEQIYRELIVGLQALYKINNPDEKEAFIRLTRLAWVYCPDEVVCQLNGCLDALTVAPAGPSPQQEALGKAVQAMRRDLMPQTTLSHRDFRHVSA